MYLSETQMRFILHWGERATSWGINRTVAQLHALLYVSQEPLDAEEIAETLQISRSNVSISLRELQSWNLLRMVQKMGERKTYYETLDDSWEMFRIVVSEKEKREINPTISLLRDLLMRERERNGDDQQHVTKRLEDLLRIFEHASAMSRIFVEMPAEQSAQLLELIKNMVESARTDTSQALK